MKKKNTAGAILAMMFVFLSACTDQEGTHEVLGGNAAGQNAEKEPVSEKSGSADRVYEGMLQEPAVCGQKNTYDTLNVATYITKVDDTYFLADCYHDQVLYHDNITDPIGQWSVLTDDVHHAHTIASDGTMFVVDDTENNRLMVYQKTADGYVHTQTLENIGMRPHYVQYDAQRQVFLAWSSITGEMYLVKRAKEPQSNGIYPLYVDRILKLDELYGVYVRSFTVLEDGIYFVSGHNNQKIVTAAVNEAGDGLDILGVYDVADRIAGMVQLTKIGGLYYITVSTDNQENQDAATIIRTDSLEKLAKGEYEDIYAQFGLTGGTPYYITEVEGRYFMAHHRTPENIVVFDVRDDQIENVEILY
ncbi:MAG: hypothetical protein K2P39_08070 [Lachnospiraceae bacterium]|nr:hypothetical protein [Lachnospiraceae bacterium]